MDILILSWITVTILYAFKDLLVTEYKWMLLFIPIGASELSDEVKEITFAVMFFLIFIYRNFYKDEVGQGKDKESDKMSEVEIEIIAK